MQEMGFYDVPNNYAYKLLYELYSSGQKHYLKSDANTLNSTT